MAIITIKDVLDHAERFEQMLADYYTSFAHRASRDGVRLLVDYMGRHRKRIAQVLEELSPEHVQRICSEPLRYEPQAADRRCFEGIDLPDGASAADVLDVAVRLDECLAKLYRQVLQQPVDEEVREFFESLLHAEEGDEIELKKIKALDYF